MAIMSAQDTTKGEWSEFKFDFEAIKRGLIVCRPIHAGTVYDRVVEYQGKFIKVQIKSSHTKPSGSWTINRSPNTYRVNLKKYEGNYELDDVDVFAIYITPLETWYFIPSPCPSVLVLNSFGKYSKHINDWSIFYATKIEKED